MKKMNFIVLDAFLLTTVKCERIIYMLKTATYWLAKSDMAIKAAGTAGAIAPAAFLNTGASRGNGASRDKSALFLWNE